MIVSIHQPAYLPWLGYLARIAASDVFVYLDTVQFEKNSFTNRNRIKTANGPIWLTVPILQQGHLSKRLMDIDIDNRQDWRRKHLRSIEQNYSRAPRFAECFPRFADLYKTEDVKLVEICFRQLRFWLDELSIKTQIVRSSELPVAGQKSGLVLDICRHLGASAYLSGPLGRDYLDELEFSKAGISLSYQNYTHPEYIQLHGHFIPAMGVIDYWINCGDSQLFRKVESAL